MEDLNAKLTPSHLADPGPSMDELKQRIEAAVAPKPTTADEKKLRMRERRYTFPFSFRTKTEELFAFTSLVPDVRTRGMIGVMRAQLSGGLPYTSIDPFTNEMNLMVATLAYSLEAKSGESLPAWAQDLRTVTDVDVIYALYEEVSAHETTFLGRR
jgi:hypothetical protein